MIEESTMIKIIPIPALSDNYVWLLIGSDSQSAYVVDPGDAIPVLDALNQHQLKLCGILITHHHWDHVGGIPKLLEHYPNIPVYGPAHEHISGVSHPLQEGSKITLEELGVSFSVLDIPGHTLGHIAYHNDEQLFCGDTLFASGCGRIFEGTPEMMYASLNKLKALSSDLSVYCAHEYTEANLKFALKVEPDSEKLKTRLEKVQNLRKQNKPSLPVTLNEEKETNPFLRCTSKSIQSSVARQAQLKSQEPVEVFAALRQWKDNF